MCIHIASRDNLLAFPVRPQVVFFFFVHCSWETLSHETGEVEFYEGGRRTPFYPVGDKGQARAVNMDRTLAFTMKIVLDLQNTEKKVASVVV